MGIPDPKAASRAGPDHPSSGPRAPSAPQHVGGRKAATSRPALALTAAVGIAVGYLTSPFLGHRASLVVAVALGGGAGAALSARISGQPRPLLHALYTAVGGALGAYPPIWA